MDKTLSAIAFALYSAFMLYVIIDMESELKQKQAQIEDQSKTIKTIMQDYEKGCK